MRSDAVVLPATSVRSRSWLPSTATDARAVGEPQPPSCRLFLRHLQPLASPEPFHPLVIPRLPQDATGAPFRDAQLGPYMGYGLASPGRAQNFPEATSFKIALSSA